MAIEKIIPETDYDPQKIEELSKLDVLQERKRKVFCQTCGSNLTEEGGYVSDEGRIYCYSLLLPRLTCGDIVAKHTLRKIKFSYKTNEEIQKEIAEGRLTHFSSLERTAFD